MNRRTFLASTAAAAGPAQPAQKLAINGGTPVRTTPLAARHFGPLYYDEKERAELLEVLETRRPFRWWGAGKEPPAKVANFEKEFAAFMKVRYALAVTSGTAALECSMAALGIGPGDEVILPSWTWHSCASSVIRAGALPVFAEIDESFNIDPSDIEHRITPATKLIMAVHLQGNPADMDRILAVARKHRIRVLEDCAQSVGGSYKGRPLGSIGEIGIFSLQLSKTITAGEGGAVVTSDPLLFERAARFHDTGAIRKPHEDWIGEVRDEGFAGTNFRMNEFSGGVLLAQLRKLGMIVNSCRANARRVYDGIRDLPGARLRTLPDPSGEIGSAVFLGFPNKDRRDRFVEAMTKENVPARPPGGSVILPVQKYIMAKRTPHPAWPSFTSERGRAIQYGPAACPRTIDILDRFAGVSIDPKFTKADTDDIVAAIRKVYPALSAA
ncbi:MAG TPA: DegT/DnrJ/EryC1/StrS family aminotransferase [Bryobacteraceae bacterium]|nr:DegT/DnrJ/EryC1/StrS family aminotransferase [Bryobacteraceae bacterium]